MVHSFHGPANPHESLPFSRSFSFSPFLLIIPPPTNHSLPLFLSSHWLSDFLSCGLSLSSPFPIFHLTLRGKREIWLPGAGRRVAPGKGTVISSPGTGSMVPCWPLTFLPWAVIRVNRRRTVRSGDARNARLYKERRGRETRLPDNRITKLLSLAIRSEVMRHSRLRRTIDHLQDSPSNACSLRSDHDSDSPRSPTRPYPRTFRTGKPVISADCSRDTSRQSLTSGPHAFVAISASRFAFLSWMSRWREIKYLYLYKVTAWKNTVQIRLSHRFIILHFKYPNTTEWVRVAWLPDRYCDSIYLISNT